MAFPAWPDLSLNQLEQRQLETWKSEGLFRQTMEATRNGPPFVFYEGPPTANGRPGIHHVFSRTIKDLVCRFHSMQGESVTRIAGWDTHGLPVEIEVEKELKLTGKKDIDRNVLEWRLDPSCDHHIPDCAGYGTRIVIVCNEGYSSSLAAALLHDIGLERATDLIGGYQAWLAHCAA